MDEASSLKAGPTALVFGATGYTGAAVVRRWVASGPVVAHIRPGSASGPGCQAEFEAIGAQVRVVPWEPAALTALVGEVKPDVVFSLLGTTRARAKDDLAPDQQANPYQAVDERLSIMAATAVKQAAPAARFIYLSALGVNKQTRNSYLKARLHVEQALSELGLKHVVARPAFISGPDRNEFRLGERVAARALDGALGLAALTGLRGLRELRHSYASLSGDELAAALVAIAQDNHGNSEVLPAELRQYAAGDKRKNGANKVEQR